MYKTNVYQVIQAKCNLYYTLDNLGFLNKIRFIGILIQQRKGIEQKNKRNVDFKKLLAIYNIKYIHIITNISTQVYMEQCQGQFYS